jgi:hypothetical protein
MKYQQISAIAIALKLLASNGKVRWRMVEERCDRTGCIHLYPFTLAIVPNLVSQAGVLNLASYLGLILPTLPQTILFSL